MIQWTHCEGVREMENDTRVVVSTCLWDRRLDISRSALQGGFEECSNCCFSSLISEELCMSVQAAIVALLYRANHVYHQVSFSKQHCSDHSAHDSSTILMKLENTKKKALEK